MTKFDALFDKTAQGGAPQTIALVLFCIFCIALAAFGGSSQQAMLQAVFLRPLAALMLIPALYFFAWDKKDPANMLIALCLGLSLLMGVQLIPLPPSLWHAIPGREGIVNLENTLNVEAVWRPISVVPSRTFNALASMTVPMAALLLALSLRLSKSTLLHGVLALASLNAAMVFMQVLSGYDQSFYFYAIGSDRADGIFGNENHSGVFSAIAMLIAARLGTQKLREPSARSKAAGYIFVSALLFLCVLIGGSRAAFACSLLSTMVSFALLFRARRKQHHRNTKGRTPVVLSPKLIPALFVAGIVALVSAFLWLERSPSLDGLMSQNSFEDLRWRLAPILWSMIEQNWMLGIGFGAFEEYYHSFEPSDLLMPAFVNQAHNDWAQLAIEGGVIALALLIGLLVWTIRQCWKILSRPSEGLDYLIFWLGVFSIISVASLVDYPLRTAIYQCAGVWFLICLARDANNRKRKSVPETGEGLNPLPSGT